MAKKINTKIEKVNEEESINEKEKKIIGKVKVDNKTITISEEKNEAGDKVRHIVKK